MTHLCTYCDEPHYRSWPWWGPVLLIFFVMPPILMVAAKLAVLFWKLMGFPS